METQIIKLAPHLLCPPPFVLYKSKKKNAKNPGIMLVDSHKFYCHKIGKPRKDGSIQFTYYCADRDAGCKAIASITSVKVWVVFYGYFKVF